MTQRQDGRCGAPEPRIEELLEDSVLHAILRRDRITRDELMAVIASARRRLGINEDAR